MDIVELNVKAKGQYLLAKARQRRNSMARWRKCQTLVFLNNEDFQNWLNYTKWHKRPVKIVDNDGTLVIEFLDYKGKKNGPGVDIEIE